MEGLDRWLRSANKMGELEERVWLTIKVYELGVRGGRDRWKSQLDELGGRVRFKS